MFVTKWIVKNVTSNACIIYHLSRCYPQQSQNPGNAATDMSEWWVTLCYVCDSVMYVTSVIDVSSTHMSKIFNFYMAVCRSNRSMILDMCIFFKVSWLFSLFLVCFVLDLCCYLHDNIAQVYMSCVLTFWHQSMNMYTALFTW